MIFRGLLGILVCFSPLLQSCDTVMQNVIWTDNSSFVMYHNTSLTFINALQYCGAASGSLASIGSTTENSLLAQILSDNLYENAWFGMFTFFLNQTGSFSNTDNSGLSWLYPNTTGFADAYYLPSLGTNRYMRYFYDNALCVTLDLNYMVVAAPLTNVYNASCAISYPVICKYTPSAGQACGSSWRTRNGFDNVTKCYQLLQQSMNWWQAVGSCFALNDSNSAPGAGYLLYIDGEDQTEMSDLYNMYNYSLGNNSVWLGALDINPIIQEPNVDYWLDGSSSTFRASGSPANWNSRSVYCPVLQRNGTWRTTPLLASSSNYSTMDCIQYQAPAAFCRLPNRNSIPNSFSPRLNPVVIQNYNFTVSRTSGSVNGTIPAGWMNALLSITGASLVNIQLVNISNSVIAQSSQTSASVHNLTVQCANIGNIWVTNASTSYLSMYTVNSATASVDTVNNSVLIIDYRPFAASSCAAATNSSSSFASSWSNKVASEVVSLANAASCTATSSNATVTIITVMSCVTSGVFLVSAGSATLILSNVTSAKQNIQSANGSLTSLSGVGTNEYTLSNVSYVSVFVNVVWQNYSCLATYGSVLYANQVLNNTLIVSDINSYASNRVSNVMANNMFFSSVQVVNSSIGNTVSDFQNYVNCSTVTSTVASSQDTVQNYATVRNVYSTFWSVNTAYITLTNITNATIAATKANQSTLQCYDYINACVNNTSNFLNFQGSSLVNNFVSCNNNLDQISYAVSNGGTDELDFSMAAGTGNVTIGNYASTNTSASLSSASVLTYSVNNCNYSSLTIASDSTSASVVSANSIVTNAIKQTGGLSASLWVTNATTSSLIVCAQNVIVGSRSVNVNNVALCAQSGYATLTESDGLTSYLNSQMPNVAVTVNNVANVTHEFYDASSGAALALSSTITQCGFVSVSVYSPGTIGSINFAAASTSQVYFNGSINSPSFNLSNVNTSSVTVNRISNFTGSVNYFAVSSFTLGGPGPSGNSVSSLSHTSGTMADFTCYKMTSCSYSASAVAVSNTTISNVKVTNLDVTDSGTVTVSVSSATSGSALSATLTRLSNVDLAAVSLANARVTCTDVSSNRLYVSSDANSNATITVTGNRTTSNSITLANVGFGDATIRYAGTLFALCVNVTRCSVSQRNVSTSRVDVSNVPASSLVFDGVDNGTITCGRSQNGAPSMVDVFVVQPNCPIIDCDSEMVTFRYTLSNVSCPLPTTKASVVMSTQNTPNSTLEASVFTNISVILTSVTQSSLSFSNGSVVSVVVTDSQLCSTNISISQTSNSTITVSNLGNAVVSLNSVASSSVSFRNLTNANVTLANTTSYFGLSKVSSITFTLASSGKSVTLTNVSNVEIVLEDAPTPSASALRDLMSLQQSLPSTAVVGLYTYTTMTGNLTWGRAVEQCAVINSGLSSIMNDMESILFASQAPLGSSLWLGGMGFSYCQPLAVLLNRVRWMYINDTRVAGSTMVSLWPPIRSLCLAFSFDTQLIQEPVPTQSGPSCFRTLPFICKMPLVSSDANCPTGWSKYVGSSSVCYLLVSQPMTWSNALGYCAQKSVIWPATVGTQSRLLDFDASDLGEVPFLWSVAATGGVRQVWISGLNYNPVCEANASTSVEKPIYWLDQSTFIPYGSSGYSVAFNTTGRSCPPVTYWSEGLTWSPASNALTPPSDCIDQIAAFAVCKNASAAANGTIYVEQQAQFGGGLTLHQAILACGNLNGTVASISSRSVYQRVASTLNATTAWLGLITFPKCEATGSRSVAWSDADSRLKTDFRLSESVSTLCVSYRLVPGNFSTPTKSNLSSNLASCFQQLPFICKQIITDNSVQCMAGWARRNATNGSICYYYSTQNSSSTWPKAAAYCASSAFGTQTTNVSLSASVTTPRLLYFFTSDFADEQAFLRITYPNATEIWTMALSSGPVCEKNIVKDYWLDGTPFIYLGSTPSSWIGRNTFCPLLTSSLANGNKSYDWSATNMTSLGSLDCSSTGVLGSSTTVTTAVICNGMICTSSLNIAAYVFKILLLST